MTICFEVCLFLSTECNEKSPQSQIVSITLTRGVSVDKLMNSKLWLNGPQNLFCESAYVDSASGIVLASVSDEAISHQVAPLGHTGPLFDVERWGTLCKAIRVVAWVIRFISYYVQ